MSSVMDVDVRPYTRTEFRCNACNVTYRVDSEFSAGPVVGRGQKYQHCARDENRQIGGPIVAVWERRGPRWVLLANRMTVPH